MAVAAGAAALAVVRPFATGPVGFDSASSVAFFQQLVAGQRLEAYVGTTPKPLLTVVYGSLYGLFGDWRVISWATIAAYAVAVALAARLAGRLAGLAAATFATAGLIALPLLMADLILAYATPWAMLGWFTAGLLVTGPRPRFGWAGAALLLATLARLETLALVGCALVVLAAIWLAGRLARRQARRPIGGPVRLRLPDLPDVPARAWLLTLALLALPLMALHDWLLAGDPFYWAHVSAAYSAADPASVQAPGQLLAFIVDRYRHRPVLSALAVTGGAYLLRGVVARWRGPAARAGVALAVGLAGLGPGVAAFLLLLAARGTYVSTRYFAAVDVAMVAAAAIGAGAIVAWLLGRVEARGIGRAKAVPFRLATGVTLGVAAALLAQPAPAPLTASIQEQAAAQRTLDIAADDALPVIQAQLDAISGARSVAPGVTWDTGRAPPPVLMGPALLRTRLAVDLALPLSAVGGLGVASLQPGPRFLGCAALVLHVRAGDDPTDGYEILEVASPVTIDADVTLVPLIARPSDGAWLIRVERSGAAAATCATTSRGDGAPGS